MVITSPTGESWWVGPAELVVEPESITIYSSGPASRYPAEMQVFGQSSNFARVEVALDYLSHDRPEDLDILLVSPSGTNIMLMSDAGGTNAVDGASLLFTPLGFLPPEGNTATIPAGQETPYRASNYGELETLPMPAPSSPH